MGWLYPVFFLQVLSTVHRGLACHSSKKRPQCRRPPTPFGAFGALRGARRWESKRLAVDPVVSLERMTRSSRSCGGIYQELDIMEFYDVL